MKIILFVILSVLCAVEAYNVKAPFDVKIGFPHDTIQLRAKATLEKGDFKSVVADSVLVLDAVATVQQCPTIDDMVRGLSELAFQYYIPKRTSSRMPLIIGTKISASVSKDAIKMADTLGAAVLSVTGFDNSMGYQGGVGSSRNGIQPIMFNWSIDAVTCIIKMIEDKHDVTFSGWYPWGHSGAGQFAHKFAFYKEFSNGYNVPKMVKCVSSSSPGHPYLAGYNDIAVRKRIAHQYQFHSVGYMDDRKESVENFALLMAKDPNMYGRIFFELRTDTEGHRTRKRSVVYKELTEQFGYVMKLNDDLNPLQYEWSASKKDAKNVIFDEPSDAAPKVTFKSPGKYELTVTVSDNGKKPVSDTVTVTVEGGDDPLPQLSVYASKNSVSMDSSSPGFFEIRSNKKIRGNGIALNYKVHGKNVVVFTEETYKCFILSREFGRYGFESDSTVPARMEEGTETFYVIVHGDEKGKKGAALLELLGDGDVAYTVNNELSRAELLVQPQALDVKKVVPSEGGRTMVSIDSPTFAAGHLHSFEVVKPPKFGTLRFYGDKPQIIPSFSMGIYDHDRGVVCKDSFSYRVKVGGSVVASGVVEISPSYIVGPCDDSIASDPPKEGNKDETGESEGSPFDKACMKKSSEKKCLKLKKKVNGAKIPVCEWQGEQCVGISVK